MRPGCRRIPDGPLGFAAVAARSSSHIEGGDGAAPPMPRSYFFGFAFAAGFDDLPADDLPAPPGGAVSIHGFVLTDFGVIVVEVFLGMSIPS